MISEVLSNFGYAEEQLIIADNNSNNASKSSEIDATHFSLPLNPTAEHDSNTDTTSGAANAAKRPQGRQVASRFMTSTPRRTSNGDVMGDKDQAAHFAQHVTMSGVIPSAMKLHAPLTSRKGGSVTIAPTAAAFLTAAPGAASTSYAINHKIRSSKLHGTPANQGQRLNHATFNMRVVTNPAETENPETSVTPAQGEMAAAVGSGVAHAAASSTSETGTQQTWQHHLPDASTPSVFVTPMGPKSLFFAQDSSANPSHWGARPGQGMSVSTPAPVALSSAKLSNTQATVDRRLALQKFKEDKQARRQSLGGGMPSNGRPQAEGSSPQRRESMPGVGTAGRPGVPPLVPKLRLNDIAHAGVANPGNVTERGRMMRPPLPRSSQSSGGAPPPSGPPPQFPAAAAAAALPTARTRAAAKVPLPDANDMFGLATPRATPRSSPARTQVIRSPLATASPRVTMSPRVSSEQHRHAPPEAAAAGRSGQGQAMDVRAEIKAGRIHALQLRFINARMEQALAVRTQKSERALAACALSIAELHDDVAAAKALHSRQELLQRLEESAASLGPLVEQWSHMQAGHAVAAGNVTQAIQDALTSVPLINGAYCGKGRQQPAPASSQWGLAPQKAEGHMAAAPAFASPHAAGPTGQDGMAQQPPRHVGQFKAAMERAAAALQALQPCINALQPQAHMASSTISSGFPHQSCMGHLNREGNGSSMPVSQGHSSSCTGLENHLQPWSVAAQQGCGTTSVQRGGTSQQPHNEPQGCAMLPTAALLMDLTDTVRDEVVVLGRVMSKLRKLRDKTNLIGSYEAQMCGM